MRDKIVWALFDSEANSCFNALSPHCQVFSFGVGTGKNHIQLDLSCFEAARRALCEYPSPDYIFAFPPCETWSLANASCKAGYTSEPGINLYWRNRFTPFDFTPELKEKNSNGIRTALVTAKIIEHFKPQIWAVENGFRSLIFDWLSAFGNLTGYRNKCDYYSYGFNVWKKTIILSNSLLFLKNSIPPCRLKSIQYLSGYAERSKVPHPLLVDIFRQFENGRHGGLFQ